MSAPARTFIYMLLSFLLCCPFVISAQWHKKPSAQRSEKDAKDLLKNSPWVKTMSRAFPAPPVRNTPPAQEVNGKLEMPSSRTSTLYIRMISAKPVREALRQSGAKRDD